MGKFANALGKYAQERKTARLQALSRADLDVLMSYNRNTGHLLNHETDAGQVAGRSMEVLGNRGTIQRLLDHKLIYPGGKLTAKGLAECERLKNLKPPRKPAGKDDPKIKQKILEDINSDNVVIELKDEVAPARPTGAFEPPREKGAPRFQRPTTTKSRTDMAFEVKDMPAGRAPIEASTIEPDQPEGINEEIKSTTALFETPAKPGGKTSGGDRPSMVVPGASVDDKMIYKNLVSLINPQSYEAEQFKILRNNLLFPVAGKAPRSILITSSLPGEGKSFVAANLAVSIAMNINKHVLLIDCDLRKPDLHRIFGLGDVPGLSDYLVQRRTLASLLERTYVERLSLLPGGPVPPNPSELASSERMSEMLEEVKHRYSDRLIVVDSPPPSMAAETSFLARQVDGIVLVVQYGKTPRESVEDIMHTVGTEKILGTVINYLDLHMSKRYGYGKYGKYGTYGKGKR